MNDNFQINYTHHLLSIEFNVEDFVLGWDSQTTVVAA